MPQIFVAHAYPTPFSPPLRFTGESAPMDAGRFARPVPVIGIFPPKAISWRTFAAIVGDRRVHFRASRIEIRCQRGGE